MNPELLPTVGVIGFVLLILNVVFLALIFFMRRRMAVVSQWPATMGAVTASYQMGGQAWQGMKVAPGPR